MQHNINALTIENVKITGGFWSKKQKLIREVSMQNVYKRFYETGRFSAFNFTWREGEENKPHVYWDSDVAKWIEAVGYICQRERVPELEKIVDGVVDAIEKNRMSDGYFNSYFGHLEPNARFTRRNDHELYCLGHLIEGAIAYKKGTGKDKLLKMMIEYADLVYKIFYEEKSAGFLTPGHQELELALVKLYRETGNKKYLDLALYFVNTRGTDAIKDAMPEPISLENVQSHIPVRKQKKAVGHAVRACYLYSAIADLAKETNDGELFETAKTLFDNVTSKRMYVTGAVGQNPVGEAFSDDYDLPNQTAYAETCANLSLALFARRMSLIEPDSIYADTAERVLYNSFISGISLDGKSFFYSNMQENDLQVRRRKYGIRQTIFCPADTRVEVFKTSCCPPNVVRTVSSIQDFAYSADADTLFVHQYMESDVDYSGKSISVKTEYPFDERVNISYAGGSGRIALRIPAWCKKYEISKNGKILSPEIKRGYAYIDMRDGDEIKIIFDMPVRFLEANPKIWVDAGRVALCKGPIVYCMEGVDNPYPLSDIRLDKTAEYKSEFDHALGYPVLESYGYIRNWENKALYDEECGVKPVPVRLIPYFAFANRGETDMIIWTLKHG
ncbi:MAG: glycoside hydrolase family 127 protein [Ruminococcaceae bacterium]|nr:glycoside hydrolase family 127 protein [Oscillospiraceae bacterium]